MDSIGSNSYRNYLSTSSGRRNTEKQATSQAKGQRVADPIRGELNLGKMTEEKLPYVHFG